MSICSLQTYDKASAAKLSNYPVRNQSFFHSPHVTCFPYCFLYHSMHYENIALQGGCMRPFIFEGALSPVFAEFADRGKFSIELQQESAAFGGHPLSGFAGLPPIQGQNNPLYDSPIPIGLRQQKSSPEGLLFSLEKLLIRPILLHGRAQAFCFNESARGSRLSGMSVSSRKYRYSHGCHQDF